jgi:hypothetical protein
MIGVKAMRNGKLDREAALQRDRQRVLDDLVRGLDERKATPADR